MNARAQQMIAEARAWLGTPWRHQGRVKGHGVDCVGFVALVGRDAGLIDVDEAANYGRRPDGVTLRARLDAHLEPVSLDALAPGVIVLMATDGVPDHVGLITDYPGAPGELALIHAYVVARKVVEHRLDDAWRRRIVGAYRVPEAA
jgi:cell wall-associated NlpC family hydrolase